MMDANGKATCDCCGADLGNGGIDKCLIVSDLDPRREGFIENLHFCRTGPGKCAKRIRRAAVLVDYTQRRNEAAGARDDE